MGDCACHANDLHLKWDGSGLAFVFLELTPLCNNRCPGCSNVFERVQAPLSGQEWIRLIEHLDISVQWFKLTGGEPTLHPHFDQIVAFLNRCGRPFRLLTNGRWTNLEHTLSTLVESPMLESLLISLHGPDAPTHEAFTGVPGSFKDAVTTVAAAAKAGLEVATSTVITGHNWHRIGETIQLALDLGAVHVAFNRYIGAYIPELTATPDEEVQALAEVERLVSTGAPARFGTPIPQCLLPNSTTPCLAGRAFVTVDPWGNVRPCNHTDLVIGNLLQDSLTSLVHSPLLHRWLVDVPVECTTCAAAEICGAGCRAMPTTWREALEDLPVVVPSPVF